MESGDPRGPERKITAVQSGTGLTVVTLDCGHTAELNQIYTYRVGERCRCLKCRKEGRS